MSSSSLSESIADRLTQIRQSLPPTVRLIAVSKQVSVEAMRVAYDLGIREFGESRIQEAVLKQTQLQGLSDITWHFIGQLQSNKAAKAVEHFQWIHSVDSLRLAERLDRLAGEMGKTPQICLQVKLLPDPTKTGWSVPDLWRDLPALDQCHHLNSVGLMTIPPYGLSPSETQAVFLQTRDLAEQIRQHPWTHLNLHHLSMGMSDDYPLALQAGSTMIRLGRVLFGDRPANQELSSPIG